MLMTPMLAANACGVTWDPVGVLPEGIRSKLEGAQVVSPCRVASPPSRRASTDSTLRTSSRCALRARFSKSQTEFALMIGVSVATLRNWEQGRRTPDGPALALLRVASAAPNAVEKALRGAAGLLPLARRMSA